MNRLVRYLFFGLSAVVLQTSLVPSLSIFGQRPDLVVVFALIVGAYEGSSLGCAAGFLVGLAVDLYHPPTMGAGAMAGTLAGYLGGKAQVFLDLDVPLNQGAAFAAGLLAHDAVYSIVASLQGEGNMLWLFAGRAFGGAVYTALVGTACLSAAGLIRGRKHVVDRR
ncbi:MAG: rod shape-determining protein MreD [Candidatus Latescibacteria bacterium]|nr:rod shape-determining protein MreD [Candidatus Latescibacterota bacterium]